MGGGLTGMGFHYHKVDFQNRKESFQYPNFVKISYFLKKFIQKKSETPPKPPWNCHCVTFFGILKPGSSFLPFSSAAANLTADLISGMCWSISDTSSFWNVTTIQSDIAYCHMIFKFFSFAENFQHSNILNHSICILPIFLIRLLSAKHFLNSFPFNTETYNTVNK